MVIYILTIVALIGINAATTLYNVLVDNVPQRTRSDEACNVIACVAIVIWGVILLLG